MVIIEFITVEQFVACFLRLLMDNHVVSIYDTGKWKEGVADSVPHS